MKSLADEVDGFTIAAEVRMERQVHKGAFLLLEGSTDIKRFGKFIDEIECSTVNCYGKSNVKDAIFQLYDEGFPGALGMIDRDFDLLLGSKCEHEGLICSENHDFDLDMFLSDAFKRYISEVGSERKLQEVGDIDALRLEIMSITAPLSCLRFANEFEKLGYRLKEISHHHFCDGRSIEIEALINHVSVGRFSAAEQKQHLKEVLDKYCAAKYNKLQLTNGHDVFAVTGIMLQERFGDRRYAQTWGSEVEMHLRLAYDRSDFRSSLNYTAIRYWQESNKPYIILDNTLV